VSERTATDTFADFVRRVEPRLGDALVAALGPDVGREATEEALIYAWQHWDRVGGMENPGAYLYRVGQSKAKRYRRRERLFPAPPPDRLPMVEPKLAPALAGLTEKQRAAVLLIHGFGWTHAEVAEFLEVALGTVQKHVERAMAKLRGALEVEDGA
jgi:DNA-directed RNA polymerase specialized sigma24 family protein